MAVPWGVLMGAGGTFANMVLTAINNKKMRTLQDANAAKKKAELDAEINQNPLSTSANQHLLGRYDRDAQRQVQNAQGVAKITGATNEYATGVQKAVAEGRADLMGQMSAGASERADKLKAEKRQVEQQDYA